MRYIEKICLKPTFSIAEITSRKDPRMAPRACWWVGSYSASLQSAAQTGSACPASFAPPTQRITEYPHAQVCGYQCCGSMTFGVDPDPRIHASDYRIRIQIRMRIRILLFSLLTFKKPTKTNCFKKFFCMLLFEGTVPVHFRHFSKIKSQKEVFFLIFLLNDRRIWIRSRIWIHTSD